MPSAKPSTSYLYRIVPFHRFAQAVRTRSWYFAHPSEWDDPYETKIRNDLSDRMFAQCWCRKAVSDAMWRIYSKDNLGVRIRVEESALRSALDDVQALHNVRFLLNKVMYVNERRHHSEATKIARGLSKGLTELRAAKHLFLKRLAFEHEAEVRLVMFDYREPPVGPTKGRSIELDTVSLVSSVLIDPRAPDELAEALILMLKTKLGFTGQASKSTLYRQNATAEI